MTENPVPKRLRKEPLLEALWEIRFTSDSGSVVELLPGLLYQALGMSFPRIERLPAANLPLPVLQQDTSLRYVPTLRLEGTPYSIQIGEHVVSLSCQRPYTGWAEFERTIFKLVEILRATALLSRPERFSLKYVNVISLSDVPSLRSLHVSVSLSNRELSNRPIQLRAEVNENRFLHIVQVVSPAQATLQPGETFAGVLLDIDTICIHESGQFWSNFAQELNCAHEAGKQLFFSLLTQETIALLEPEY
jgi:uncharacterized protein (TIGR04255 family)